MNASDATAINSKAFTLAQMGKNEEGLSVIEKAVQDNPNNVHLQITMAFILANLGREDEARTYYEKALQINPNLTKTLTVQKEIDAFNKVMGNKTIMQ